jgi:hypothetical protein
MMTLTIDYIYSFTRDGQKYGSNQARNVIVCLFVLSAVTSNEKSSHFKMPCKVMNCHTQVAMHCPAHPLIAMLWQCGNSVKRWVQVLIKKGAHTSKHFVSTLCVIFFIEVTNEPFDTIIISLVEWEAAGGHVNHDIVLKSFFMSDFELFLTGSPFLSRYRQWWS